MDHFDDKLRDFPITGLYAGIGSRKTPADICDLMERIADCLHDDGYVLRSGHARGADQAFERGCHGRGEIFLPWPDYNILDDLNGKIYFANSRAFKEAAKFHPSWHSLSRAGQKLHARNAHIILGPNLDDPVQFVICWTEKGQISGGTGQALRMAQHYGIPVTNLADPVDRKAAYEWVL